jgi:transposase
MPQNDIFRQAQRFGCNMISAITNRGSLNFMVFKKRFRDTIFPDFLKRKVRQTKQKVFLIVDRHPVHRSIRVKRWLNGKSHRINLYFLPAYGPELNPDEMLNQDIKSSTVSRRRTRNQEELISTVRKHLRSRQRQPYIVRKYFKEQHVQYAVL